MLVKLVAMVAAWFDTDRSIACAMRRAPADCLPFSFPHPSKANGDVTSCTAPNLY